MTLHYKSCGISNVWLVSGYTVHETKFGKAYSYADIEGLYQAITIELCKADWKMTPEVIRFLRKRLGYSQEEFGKEFGCTSQAVAKWEKGTSGIPVSVARLVRLVCLDRFAPNISLGDAITLQHAPATDRLELEYIDSKWLVAGARLPTSDDEDVFYEKFENGNQLSSAYIDDLMVRMAPEYENSAFINDRQPLDFDQTYLEALGSD